MSDKVVVQGPSVGFVGLLTLLFIGLKLGGVINWSWFWVLSPLVFSAGIFLSICALVVVLAVLGATIKYRKK